MGMRNMHVTLVCIVNRVDLPNDELVLFVVK